MSTYTVPSSNSPRDGARGSGSDSPQGRLTRTPILPFTTSLHPPLRSPARHGLALLGTDFERVLLVTEMVEQTQPRIHMTVRIDM